MSNLEKKNIKGTIFNIQYYSVNDGPGIRSIVFMKGCPLRCVWCHNPESQPAHPSLMFFKERCTGCGRCIIECKKNAIRIENGIACTDNGLCIECGCCAQVCPNEARIMSGYTVTAGEVLNQIMGDMPFYKRSGGGVTLSGGEVLAQPIFTEALIDLCHDKGINVAVESCGFAPWNVIEKTLAKADVLLYDIKHMDELSHKMYTGVSNTGILENLIRLHNECNKQIVVRVPVIPGYNDSEENIKTTAVFVAENLGRDVKMEFLPYHNFGEIKNERLGLDCVTKNLKPPTAEYLEKLKKIAENYKLNVSVS